MCCVVEDFEMADACAQVHAKMRNDTVRVSSVGASVCGWLCLFGGVDVGLIWFPPQHKQDTASRDWVIWRLVGGQRLHCPATTQLSVGLFRALVGGVVRQVDVCAFLLAQVQWMDCFC